MNRAKMTLVVALMSTVTSASVSYAKQVQWADIPTSVQKALTAHTNGGTFDKIDKTSTKGKTVFDALRSKPDGARDILEVDENGSVVSVTPKPYDGEKLAKDVAVSISKARVLALKAHRGEIADEELEKEKGGSGLRYSFDIRDGGKTYEVGVDAQTGKVLENGMEGKAGVLEDAVEGKVRSH